MLLLRIMAKKTRLSIGYPHVVNIHNTFAAYLNYHVFYTFMQTYRMIDLVF